MTLIFRGGDLFDEERCRAVKGWEVHEKPIQRGGIAQKEGLEQFADLSGVAWEERRGVFEGVGVVASQCILCVRK